MPLREANPYNRRPFFLKVAPVRRVTGIAAIALLAPLGPLAQSSQEGATVEAENVEQIVVGAERMDQGAADSFGILSSAPVDTVFGLGKTLHETPRAAASLSADMLSLYGVERVTDFSNVSPGAFTASFFGLAASIDLRGSIADTHFRGIRRLTSSGGWESLIGAAHRVDIVRGPASPIHGPGSISGYLNVVPKTARADEGRFIEAPTGKVTVSAASWNRFGVEAERGGPMTLFGKPAGYHAFVFWEDADGYYNHHPGNRQFMTQGTLVVDVRDNVWVEVGHQYQRWRGAEVGGWNRIDQALIDDRLYLSGAPLVDPRHRRQRPHQPSRNHRRQPQQPPERVHALRGGLRLFRQQRRARRPKARSEHPAAGAHRRGRLPVRRGRRRAQRTRWPSILTWWRSLRAFRCARSCSLTLPTVTSSPATAFPKPIAPCWWRSASKRRSTAFKLGMRWNWIWWSRPTCATTTRAPAKISPSSFSTGVTSASHPRPRSAGAVLRQRGHGPLQQ